MAKLKGWLTGSFPISLTLIILLFCSLLSAGPVRRDELLATPTPDRLSSVGVHSRSVIRSHGHTHPGHFPPFPPHAAPTRDVKLEAPGAHQLTNLDTDLNNYAINCNNNHKATNECGKKGFSCNSNGVLATAHPVTDYFCLASCWCQSLFSPPKPIPCIVKNGRKCLVDNGIATNADTGEVVGDVSQAKTLSDGTLDFTALVGKRNTDLVHDYALVCGDRVLTGLCQAFEHRYSCSGNGRVIHAGLAERTCEAICQCINLVPRPRIPVPCYADTRQNVQHCHVIDDSIYDVNGTVVGNMTEATFLPNGTLKYTPTILEKREALSHDYALVCAENRGTTNACAGDPWKYTCNSKGKVTRKGKSSKICKDSCHCVNLKPRPKCIISPHVRVHCHMVEDTIYDENGTILGNSTDAVVHPNGTYDLTTMFAQDANVGDNSKTAILPASSTVTHSPVLPATPISGSLGGFSGFTEVVARDANKAAKVSIPVVTKVSAVPTTTPSNTLDFSTPTQLPHGNVALSSRSGPDFTPQSLATEGRFDMQCAAHGEYSQSLTDRCMSAQYTCLRIPIYPLAMLHHTGTPDAECSTKCKCLASFPKAMVADTADLAPAAISSATAAPGDSLQPVQFECWSKDKYNDTLTQHCWNNDYGCLELVHDTWLYTLHHWGDEIPECTHSCRCPNLTRRDARRSIHPKPFLPARNDPVQSPNKYKLSCGNLHDGPEFCSSADLGYFCTANMTVARNTTVHNNDAAWCDASCSCIFADAVPCINRWGIPRCRELVDGTVRHADELKVVLAYTSNVVVLANGTLLIDKAQGGFFPFVATESGFLHDGNGTSMMFNVSTNWNGTGNV
ncbi:hypothetical protein CLCR_04584 [Cladophialophora carrionii]|uniref:Uncharacterized protein n=1 Tax=Cladophialophora carrionii TaxID=86049 RepID=A0A1C1CKA7_9EURO|nr:hypothetical protein CLCR_04584 [Cladophialophora carrionii]